MSQIIKYKLLFDSYEVFLCLYEKIDNLSEILDLTEKEDNFCLINAKAIFDVNQVLCSINKSINSKLNNKLITKRLNTEILFSLYPGKNITEGLKRFGVNRSEDSVPIIALVVIERDDSKQNSISDIFDKIRGNSSSIEKIKDFRNEQTIDEIYKLKNCQNDGQKWDLIISRIATRDMI